MHRRLILTGISVLEGHWWWTSWAIACLVSWAWWGVHVLLVLARGNSPLVLPSGAVVTFGIPVVWAQVLPFFYVAAGFFVMSRRLVVGWVPLSKKPFETSAAFFCSCVIAVLLCLAGGVSVGDAVSALMVSNVVAHATAGCLPPMLFVVMGVWLAARAKTKPRTIGALVLAVFGWVSSAFLGLMLSLA